MPNTPVLVSLTTDGEGSSVGEDSADGSVRGNSHSTRLGGTTAPGAVVRVFDGTDLLGSVKSDASGIWSFLSGSVANGSHGFTASVTSADGNKSDASADLDALAGAQAFARTGSSFFADAERFALRSADSFGNTSAPIVHEMHSGVNEASNEEQAPETASSTVAVSDPLGFALERSGVRDSVAGPASKPATVIAAGDTLELTAAYSGTVSFAGQLGTLIIDQASSFNGTISGQLGIPGRVPCGGRGARPCRRRPPLSVPGPRPCPGRGSRRRSAGSPRPADR